MKKDERNASKLAVLELIKDEKDVLFGDFKSTTKERKQAAWTKVLHRAQSLGLATADRKWEHARDALYGVWKCRTMEKRDTKLGKFTGKGRGKKCVYNEVDLAILEVEGKDTPGIEGLQLPHGPQPLESSALPLLMPRENPTPKLVVKHGMLRDRGESSKATNKGISNGEYKVMSVPELANDDDSRSSGDTAADKDKCKRNTKRKKDQLMREEIKKHKLELLKVKTYVRKLEAVKLEVQLNLPPTSITKSIRSLRPSNEDSTLLGNCRVSILYRKLNRLYG